MLNIAISGLGIAHPISFGVPLLAAVISIGTLITGIEMIAVGIVGGVDHCYNTIGSHSMTILDNSFKLPKR